MVLGVAPVIGIPLPFFSAGGTSVACLFVAIGLVLSVGVHNTKKYHMFYTELANHEYSYTGDVTDAVNACGLTVEQLNANPALIIGLKKAADDQRDE